MRMRWRNLIIPIQNVVGLFLGVMGHMLYPQLILRAEWLPFLGAVVISSGAALMLWAVLTAGETEVARPARLLTFGAYERSRNPMMLAWNIIFLGIAITLNSLWLLLLLPLVVIFTHLVEIRREEQALEREFGDEYLEYKGRVRRYF